MTAEFSGIDVRKARAADAPRIAELFVQLGYATTAADVEQGFKRLEGDGATEVLLACRGEQVDGVLVMHVFAPLHVARPWAVISSLVVDEAVRSGGAGAALIARATRSALDRGCAHLELSCSEKRTRAHAFYEAQGFAEVRKRFIKQL